jgi:hypothetical protein
MSVDPGVDDALPFVVRGARQLEDVPVELDPDAALLV